MYWQQSIFEFASRLGRENPGGSVPHCGGFREACACQELEGNGPCLHAARVMNFRDFELLCMSNDLEAEDVLSKCEFLVREDGMCWCQRYGSACMDGVASRPIAGPRK